MVNKFGKYQVYQKFKTSDGVNYTPLDEYRGMLKEDFSKNCLGAYDFSYISQLRYPYITTNNTTKHTIPDECIFEVGDNWGYAYNFEDLSPLIEEPYGLYNPWERDDYTGYEHKPLEVFSLPINTAVTDLTALFSYAPLTEVDTSKWDTSNVTSMNNMFFACDDLTSLDVSNFNTSAVTSMGGMFNGCTNLTSLDVSNFDTSNVTSMSNMFRSCSGLTSLDVSNFDTSSCTYMGNMFYGCGGLKSLDVSNFDTSKVTNMWNMFWHCSGLTSLDLSSFDTSNVTDMSYIFDGCDNLTYFKHPKKGSCAIPENVVTLDLSALDSSYLSSVSFRNLEKLENIIWGDKSNATFTSLETTFSGCTSLKELDLSGWDVSSVTSASNMLAGCSALTKLNLSGWDLSSIGRYSISFSDCVSLREIEMCDATLDTIIHIQEQLAESNLPQVVRLVCNGEDVFTDQGNVEFTFTGSQCNFTLNDTSFYATSSPCKRSLMGDLGISVLTSCVSAFTNSPITSLISFPNTSNITNMSNMFDGCSNLSSIDMGLFDTSNVTNYEEMFQDCSSLTSFVFNPQNKEELWIPRMLCYCSSLKYADFSGVKFGQSNGLFYGCSSLEEINFSNADFSEIMVEGIDLQSKYIFGGCTSLKTIDLTNAYFTDHFFEVMSFYECSALEEIIVGEIDCGTWQKFEDMKADGKIPENAQLVGTCIKYRNMEIYSTGGSGPYYVEEFTSQAISLNVLSPYSYELNQTLYYSNIGTIKCIKTPVNLTQFRFGGRLASGAVQTVLVTSIDLSGWEFDKNIFYDNDGLGLFEGCNKLSHIILGDNLVNHINETGGGVNFDYMFYRCAKISSMTQVEGFEKIVNTSNITKMQSMFSVTSLQELDLSNFDFTNVTNMTAMFDGCDDLTSLDLGTTKPQNLKTCSSMFQSCGGLTSLDLSGWNTSAVTNFSYTFRNCTGLTSLDLSGWNVDKATNVLTTSGQKTFEGCKKLKKVYLYGCSDNTIAKIGNAVIEASSETVSFYY